MLHRLFAQMLHRNLINLPVTNEITGLIRCTVFQVIPRLVWTVNLRNICEKKSTQHLRETNTLLNPVCHKNIGVSGASVVAVGAKCQFFAIRRKHRE
jgi:hypothetical protein